jgi:hypothetical protein
MLAIDELRVIRDRAKVRLELALAMEQEAVESFRRDSRAYEAWRQAVEGAREAERSLEAAESEYQEALAAGL